MDYYFGNKAVLLEVNFFVQCHGMSVIERDLGYTFMYGELYRNKKPLLNSFQYSLISGINHRE